MSVMNGPQHRWVWPRSVCVATVVCVAATGALNGQPASAWDNCEVLAPDLDGVLRLDTGQARAWPCVARQAEVESNPAPPDGRPANEEVLRLKNENMRLREEAARLKDQLTQRDAAVSGKIDNKIDQRNRGGEATTLAPKGDLLSSRPQQTEIQKIPTDQKARHLDEREFERRKSVAERAWKQLLDFAVRVKKDLSGEPANSK